MTKTTIGEETWADDEAARISWSPVALEEAIIAVFDTTAVPGEQLELSFRRKEQQLAALFEQLVPAESLALQRRLTLAPPDDPIAQRFGRLISARRARLLSVLEHSRRRHPVQVARMRASAC